MTLCVLQNSRNRDLNLHRPHYLAVVKVADQNVQKEKVWI